MMIARLRRTTAMLLALSLFASLLLAVGLPPSTAHAAEDTTNFSGGDGTAENPYKVSSAAELGRVTLPGPGAYFQQIAPIDLTGDNWTPLGLFSGHYDGNGFTISNMTIVSSAQSIGLFSELNIGASLNDVTLEQFTIQASGSNSYVGGLAGHTYSGADIVDSSSSGSIFFTEGNSIGGIVGLSEGKVSQSSSAIAITTSGGTVYGVGGLIGANYGDIEGSSTSGTIVLNNNNVYTGGLSGVNEATVRESSSSVAVTLEASGSPGGLVGYNRPGRFIINSYATGQVRGNASATAGGLVGRSSGDISGSYSTGNTHTGSGGMAGGLVGYKAGGTINNSYSTGNASGSSAVFVGGFIGMNNEGDVNDSYSTGSASGGTDANGGLIGFKQGAGSINDSYYLTGSGASSFGGSPKTAEQLKQQLTFGSWDFDHAWRIVDGFTYPALDWQPYSADESTAIDYLSLTWDVIKGANSTALNVTEDLVLPATGDFGSSITWSASQSGYINTSTGAVTRATDDDHEVTLTATISIAGGTVRTKDFVVAIIEAPNNKPNRKGDAAETVEAKVTLNTPYTLNLGAIFEDADGDPLSYKVSVGGEAAVAASETYSYTPVTADAVTLVFTASDEEEASNDTYTVELTVNRKPDRQGDKTATAEATVMVNTAYTLDLATIFEDEDNDDLTYKVSVNGATAAAADSNYSYTPTAAGITTLAFTANDEMADSTDTYTVELTANTVPVRRGGISAAAEATVTVNTLYTLNLATIFEDTDGDALSYLVSVNGATAVAAASTYSYTPMTTATVTLVFTANDGTIDSADTYTLELSVNSLPSRKADANATAAAAITVNDPYTIDLAAIFEDADDDDLTYKVSIKGAAAITVVSPYTYTPTSAGTMTLVFRANDGLTDSADTFTVTLTVTRPAGSSGGGSIPPALPEYEVTLASAAGEAKLPVKVDTAAGRATLVLTREQAKSIFATVNPTLVQMPVIPGVDRYTVEVPANMLTGTTGEGELVFETDAGSITVPADMLKDTANTEGKTAGITIGEGNKSGLSPETAAAIGDRPLVELTLELNGVKVPWSNPNAPVRITIPYAPTAKELENPEHIVIWYIDGSGNVISIPSGRYDAKSGTVTFVTTHFSAYGVAYTKRTFDDLNQVEWARQAIEIMASKGIINGITTEAFAPKAQITRADYVVLLVRTLGLSAAFEGNFADVSGDAYYYEALGVAKQLGIIKGSGGNEFRPQDNITRQDMAAMTARALEKVKGLAAAADTAVLDGYNDNADIAGYAQASMAALVQEGLISGSGGKLNPQALTTRAEAAMFLYRIYNRYA
ncbi:S-layer homology domain-containing protein [Paenibacillus sp. MCAF20]